MKKTDILYAVEESEDYSLEMDEAIQQWVWEGVNPAWLKSDGKIVVYEMRRVEVNCLLEPLAYMLEWLDDEYGGETTNTAKMVEAEEKFIKTILEEYVPWGCEPNGVEHTIDLHEWMPEHEPDLYEELTTEKE